MKSFFSFLFLFLSEVVSKILFDDLVFKHVEICEEKHEIAMSKNRLLNQSTVFSKDFDEKGLCFLECVYRASSLIDEKESIQRTGLVTIIRKKFSFRSDSNNSLNIFSSNIMLLCNEICDAGEHCLRAIEKLECLEAMVCLHTLGFLNDCITKLIIEIETLKIIMKIGVLNFQTFFSLHKTGVLDYETLGSMYSARPSYVKDDEKRRQRRFVLYRNKWKKNQITYEISQYSKTLPRKVVDKEISRAFQQWSSILPMNITLAQPGQGDIDIRFEKFNHGDVPFDGPGSILAHTFYPITFLNGTQKSFIHFDDQENWTVNSTKGVDFFQTALHEIGHSLGLKHSNVEDSVMWPELITYRPNFTLREDDIKGIQSLYGMNTKQNGDITVQ